LGVKVMIAFSNPMDLQIFLSKPKCLIDEGSTQQ